MANKMRFNNNTQKDKLILSVFGPGERLSTREMAERLATKGYETTPQSLGNYIYHNLANRCLRMVTRSDKRTVYSLMGVHG